MLLTDRRANEKSIIVQGATEILPQNRLLTYFLLQAMSSPIKSSCSNRMTIKTSAVWEIYYLNA